MNMFEGNTTEKGIDSMSLDELIEHLGEENRKFNDLKEALDEMLKTHAEGGDETTAAQVSLILEEWEEQFGTITGIYRKIAGIQEGQVNLV